jgi:hypothetical protein
MQLHRYTYIESSLASYFSVEVGHSEQEAVKRLSAALAESAEFRRSLQSELKAAFLDQDFLWSELLSEYEVCPGLNEQQARELVHTYLWHPAFAGELQSDV